MYCIGRGEYIPQALYALTLSKHKATGHMISEIDSTRDLAIVPETALVQTSTAVDIGSFQPPVGSGLIKWVAPDGTECTERVPAQLSPFVSIMGWNDTCDFLLRFGGAEVYFARKPHLNARGSLTALVGADAVKKLAEAIGNENVRVPLANRFLARLLWAAGYSQANIARLTRQTETTVRVAIGPPKRKQAMLRLTYEDI